MIEALLRRVFKAPTVSVEFCEDRGLPRWCVTVDERVAATIGIESGDVAVVGNTSVTVFVEDNCCASENVYGMYGPGPVPVRRQIMSRLVRHLIGAAWTTAGMAIVVVTLTGAAQMIALWLCVVAFLVDLMSIAIRRP